MFLLDDIVSLAMVVDVVIDVDMTTTVSMTWTEYILPFSAVVPQRNPWAVDCPEDGGDIVVVVVDDDDVVVDDSGAVDHPVQSPCPHAFEPF